MKKSIQIFNLNQLKGNMKNVHYFVTKQIFAYVVQKSSMRYITLLLAGQKRRYVPRIDTFILDTADTIDLHFLLGVL